MGTAEQQLLSTSNTCGNNYRTSSSAFASATGAVAEGAVAAVAEAVVEAAEVTSATATVAASKLTLLHSFDNILMSPLSIWEFHQN